MIGLYNFLAKIRILVYCQMFLNFRYFLHYFLQYKFYYNTHSIIIFLNFFQRMQKILLISLLLVLSVNSFEYFLTNPEQNFNLGPVQATTIELADDESMVVVGFQSGLVETYNMQGRFLANVTGHTSPIVTIDWLQVSGFTGFVTVDSSGLVIVSYSNGTQFGNFTFPSTGLPLKNMITTGSQQTITIYLGLVYSTNIVEYFFNLNTTSFGFSRNYTISNVVTAVYSTTGYN